MNDEIKEILEWLSDEDVYIEELGYQYKRISLRETKILLDYITNLQQEIQKKNAYIKYLEEYNPKYYKGKKFYGIEGDDKNV